LALRFGPSVGKRDERRGLGEVSPLPGFHAESYEQALDQISALVNLLVNTAAHSPALALAIADLASAADVDVAAAPASASGVDAVVETVSSPTLSRLLSLLMRFEAEIEIALGPLLPSVRCGLQQALLHALSSSSSSRSSQEIDSLTSASLLTLLAASAAAPLAASVSISSAVRVASLTLRSGDSRSASAAQDTAVAKVKIGGDLFSDAARVAAFPPHLRLRLDANGVSKSLHSILPSLAPLLLSFNLLLFFVSPTF